MQYEHVRQGVAIVFWLYMSGLIQLLYCAQVRFQFFLKIFYLQCKLCLKKSIREAKLRVTQNVATDECIFHNSMQTSNMSKLFE